MTTAAIWARVSSHDQDADNQLRELRQWAADRGLDVVTEYVTEDSAWANGNGAAKGKTFDARRAEMLEAARMGQFQVVLVWSIDRISRRGTVDMMTYVRQLTDTGTELWSLKDPWVESTKDAMTRELLFGVFATLARFESERRSARIKAGLAKRKAAGQPIGRKAGSSDRGRRNRSNYVAAWEAGGARRQAQQGKSA